MIIILIVMYADTPPGHEHERVQTDLRQVRSIVAQTQPCRNGQEGEYLQTKKS